MKHIFFRYILISDGKISITLATPTLVQKLLQILPVIELANGLIALSHIVFKTFIELYLLQQLRLIQYKNQAEYDEK